MAQPRKSYAENRKEVYKFWLGLLEKAMLVVVTVAVLPYMVGQLDYAVIVLLALTSLIVIFFFAMIYLSRKLWYLPKDTQKSKDREVKND
jgi:hypothetical protein